MAGVSQPQGCAEAIPDETYRALISPPGGFGQLHGTDEIPAIQTDPKLEGANALIRQLDILLA